MKTADIKDVLLKKAGNAGQYAKLISQDFDEEAIHKFRTEIKRLRSLIRLVNTTGDEEKLKLPKNLKTLYHIAGHIRDAQQEMKKIQELHTQLPSYYDHLLLTIDTQQKAWHFYYSPKPIQKLRKRIQQHHYTGIQSDDVFHFFQKRLLYIQRLYVSSPGNEQIHNIRKQIKDMLHSAKFAEEQLSGTKHTQFSLDSLDMLSDIIGTYNDERLLLEHLSSFYITLHAGSEKERLSKIYEHETIEQHKKKQTVLDTINKFIKTQAGR